MRKRVGDRILHENSNDNDGDTAEVVQHNDSSDDEEGSSITHQSFSDSYTSALFRSTNALLIRNKDWVFNLVLNVLGKTWSSICQTCLSFLPFSVLGANTTSKPQPAPLDARTKDLLTGFHKHISQPYNKEDAEHEIKLQRLWELSFPSEKLTNRISKQWKMIGFQGTDPATDFRGGGLFALLNLIYFAEQYSESFHYCLKYFDHDVTDDEDVDYKRYPLAITGMNITMMIYEKLGWGMKP